MCLITFPCPDIECSIPRDIDEMINDSHGEQMDIYRNQIETDATLQRTLVNAEKYVTIEDILLR